MTRLTLPTDSKVRKDIPLYSGCYTYFPAALAGVATHSKISNEKHNPGEPLHHSRGKSNDHADCIARHSMDLADMLARKVVWTDAEKAAILTESRALSWRSLAWAQEIEEMFGAPLAPAARKPLTFQDFPLEGEQVQTRGDMEYVSSTPEKTPAERAAAYFKDVVERKDGRNYPPTIEADVRRNNAELKACDELVQSVSRSDSSGSAQTPAQYDQTRAQGRASLRDHSPSLQGVSSYPGCAGDPAGSAPGL